MSGGTAFVRLNGEVIPLAEARISPLCDGFLYGIGAFETMRYVSGKGIFRLAAHVARLNCALAVLGVDASISVEDAKSGIDAVIRANEPTSDAVVRLTVAAPEADTTPPVTLIHLREVSYPPALYERGVAACVETAARGELARHKTLNYAECLTAKRRAAAAGFEEVLFRDRGGYFLEGATTNLFVAREGILSTPPTTRPLLPGITRAVILELAAEMGIEAQETDVWEEDLSDASEVFLTNSVAGILPVAAIAPAYFAAANPSGVITSSLRTAYDQLTSKELE